MAYATVEDFKAYLRIPPGDTLDDAELTRALAVASRTVDHLCSQTFELAGPAPAGRYFDRPDTSWQRRFIASDWFVLPIPAVEDPSDFAVFTWNQADADYTTPVTGWELRPVNAELDGVPYTQVALPTGTAVPDVDYPFLIVARWGYTEVPEGVVQATLIQASRVFKRRDAPFGVISTPDGTTNTRLLNQVDPDVYNALNGYIKYWAAR